MEKAAPGSLLRSCDGCEIKRRFEGALGNVWSVSCGQPYPRLRFLFFSKLAPDKSLESLKVQQKRTVLQKESFQKTLVSLSRTSGSKRSSKRR